VTNPIASKDASDPDADDLCAALRGDHAALTRLVSRYQRKLETRTKRKAPDLKVFGRTEDAVSRTWELLLKRKPGSFDPSVVRAKTYLYQLLRVAIRDVRAEHATPGQPTRLAPIADDDHESATMIWPVALEDIAHDESTFHIDEVLGVHDDLEHLLDDLVAEELLRRADLTAPELVRTGLRAVHDDELTMTEAAAATGRHRTTLRRAIDRWVDDDGIAI
jgi:DNA-directed RNA polymerase specialized sigma24 family protein